MTRPLSPVEVEAELWRLSSRAEQVVTEIAQRARAAAEADAAYKVMYAQAILAAEGTVTVREARAAVATADAYLARRVAEAVLLAAQEAGRNTRSQLDALRSINTNLRNVT